MSSPAKVESVQGSGARMGHGHQVSQEAAQAAVAAFFEDTADGIDIRHLWTDRRGAFFRVNWWRFSVQGVIEVGRIHRSAFVRVVEADGRLQVTGHTEVTSRGTP